MLLKELLHLQEGRVKEALMSIIDDAIKNTKLTNNGSYEDAVKEIVKYARFNDYNDVTAGCSDAELETYVKDGFTKDEHAGLNEDAEQDEPTKPKIIAKADEFRVELDDEEQVHLIDGEETIRVSMPLVIWKELKRQ